MRDGSLSSLYGLKSGAPGPLRIAIIGRGFSGIATAIALMRAIDDPLFLWLIDPAPTLGGGLAYGQALHGELLNTRAKDISLFRDEPADFTDWLAATMANEASVTHAVPELGQIFAPRGLFGDYIQQRFMETVRASGRATVQFCDAEARGIERRRAGYRIDVDRRPPVDVDIVIVATGYGAGAKPRFGLAPFSDITAHMEKVRSVALVGSGLTMYDVLFRLRGAGFRGPVDIVSRHGLIPRPHTRRTSEPHPLPDPMPSGLRAIIAAMRLACEEAESEGRAWQSVFNGLRHEAGALWQALDDADRRRFHRHISAFYTAHRYRLPADNHRRLVSELRLPNTKLRRGRVIAVADDGLDVLWHGQQEPRRLRADLVIDCSGHRPDLAAPLTVSLLEGGLAKRDGPGIAVDVAGAVVDGAGRASHDLFVIGPLGAGSLLEITGAPEIAEQARLAAIRIRDLYAMEARPAFIS